MRAKMGNASGADAEDRGRKAGVNAKIAWELAQTI
jgi:hypothetical protein